MARRGLTRFWDPEQFNGMSGKEQVKMMSGGPFVTSQQVASAKEEAGAGWVKLYSKPQSKYEGPYMDVVAVFEEKNPVLISPDGSREKMVVEWTAGIGT